ncbi:MAG: SusC/RagA family TonB-linked outer membrane protein [Williamsia sp.]|nr:SusC/RagA family TonB-linked outer membrane protein [Williamsia sp.]
MRHHQFYAQTVLLALFSLFQLLQPLSAIAQDPGSIVKGIVHGDNNQPLSGVSVILRNGKTNFTAGTSTDSTGVFTFSRVPTGSSYSFAFSMVGYEPQTMAGYTINGDATLALDVELKNITRSMNEVVVVGYGVQTKRNVTGAISTINLSATRDLPNTNLAQTLRGRVAGVQFTDNGRPGQTGNLLIRGPRSLVASNTPLIILDGIFFNGGLADINPNDIATMDILKDASAAAIYGARAANGVILITSRRGTTAKPVIRVNAYKGFSEIANRLKLLSPERYLQKTLDYRKQTGLAADPAKVADYLTTTEAANYKVGKSLDPWKEASQAASIVSADASVSGRTENSNYFLSGSYLKEKGVMFKDDASRLSLRANIENKITGWLTIGTNAMYSHQDLSGIAADLNSLYYSSPYGTWYYPDGEPTRFTVPEEQISGSPVRNSILTKNQEINDNLFANFYGIVKLPFVPGLSYRINYSPNMRWYHNYNFTRQDKYVAANTKSANKTNTNTSEWVLENILTYAKKLNKDHEFDLTLLYGRNHTYAESTTANASQLSSDAVGWNNLNLGGTQTTTSTASKVEGISSMARLNYRFKERYLLTLTARRDGSSVFAKNNKFATFPSGALSWVMSDESFLNKVKWLDFLKLRISYGAVGNQAISPYQSLSISSTTQYVFGDGGTTSLGVYPSRMANDNLKWETTYTGNMGVDFGIFNGRIGGSLEVYNSDTKNLLIARSLPTMTGFTSIITNLGATNNRGVEITLNTVNLKAKRFEWGSNLVFSSNKNKIVHLYRSDINNDGREDDDLGNRWFIGQPINVYYDYVFDGIYQEKDQLPAGYKAGFVRLKDLNGDGKIDATNDRQIVGQGGQPKIRWGFTNNFRYDNLTLSVFVNAMQGWISDFILLDPNSTTSENSPGRALNQIDAGWWTAENQSNTRPSLVYTNPNGHSYYVSRNFVRIQDVSLSYDFPRQLLDRARIANLRAYVSGKNLVTFTKDWPGVDPESGATTKANMFPMARTVSVGLNVGL